MPFKIYLPKFSIYTFSIYDIDTVGKKKNINRHTENLYIFLLAEFSFYIFFRSSSRREYRLRYVFMGSSMSDGQLDMRFSLRAVSFDKQF